MATLASYNKPISWDGVHPDIIGFKKELEEIFPQVRVTSAKRFGNGVGKSGGKSRHNRGEALDLAADPAIQKFLYSADGDRLLKKYKVGFLDESLEHNLKKTGGTGPHFHIGKDSTLHGNSYAGNTAFKRQSYGQHDDQHTPEEATPETKPVDTTNLAVTTPDTTDAFIKSTIENLNKDKQALEEQFAKEKALAEYQNSVQEKIKKRYEDQLSLMEMINSNDLKSVTRNRAEDGGMISFESGGEFKGLNDNIQFQIETLKSQMPNFKMVNPEESVTYLKLKNVNDKIESVLNLYSTVKSIVPTVQSTTTTPNTNKDTTEKTNNATNPTTPKGGTVASKLASKLMELGLKQHQTAGILGSLGGESSQNLNPMALNPHSKAFGIAQWLGNRLTGLRQFAKERGRDFKNEDIQIEYLIHELKNNESAAFNAVKNASTLEDATKLWTTKFERPSPKEVAASLDKRIKMAKMFQQQI